MDFSRLPRRTYSPGRTPIERLERFSRSLGVDGPMVYIKRDDQLGLAGGGNKTRKLEFLVADALARGADTLITCGGVQSNHCRLTLSAAAREGLRCRLVLLEAEPGEFQPGGNGNVLLYRLLGAEKVITVPWGTDLQGALDQAEAEASAEGRRPYAIPLGGSNPLGALGYVACAVELLAQIGEAGLRVDHIVVPVGSGGTLAGVLLGLRASGSAIPVTGMSVLLRRAKAEALVQDLLRRTAAFLGGALEIPADEVRCLDGYLGEGYGLPTPGMVEAVELLARSEGILLDPTYTGKAMAGLVDLARNGDFRPGENVLFLHTGGSPGLYAHPERFAEPEGLA
jgi:D-cysteine desulfhydrase